MLSCVKSKLDSNVKSNIAGFTCVPSGCIPFAPLSFCIPYPGLLSIKCSPGIKRMVVFSIASLLLPILYENLAASISALCRVLNGLVCEFPSLVILSVESRSLGLT